VGTIRARNGKVRCNICFEHFAAPEVEISIHGFTVCPACIQSGPKAAADLAEHNAVTQSRLELWEEDPIDQLGIAKQYLATANELRGVESFYDISGGPLAVAIASVKPEDIRRGSRRKAA
jgi:hypothetical protein